jgi:predicted DNA binding CopG/RHH family protein
MNKFKKIPKFKSEDEERDFWAKADTSKYFDVSKPVKLDLSRLQPSTESISLRLPEWLLGELKILANKRDMAYQSLMKFVLAEWVQKERKIQTT